MLPVPMSLLHAPEGHHLNPALKNLADGVRVSPCHGTRIVLRSLFLCTLLRTFAQVTARVHELAASARHLKLPVQSCSCKMFRNLSNLASARTRSRIDTTPPRALQQPPCLALARASVSRLPPYEPNKTNKDQQISNLPHFHARPAQSTRSRQPRRVH